MFRLERLRIAYPFDRFFYPAVWIFVLLPVCHVVLDLYPLLITNTCAFACMYVCISGEPRICEHIKNRLNRQISGEVRSRRSIHQDLPLPTCSQLYSVKGVRTAYVLNPQRENLSGTFRPQPVRKLGCHATLFRLW